MTLELQDGSTLEYTADAPDAAKLLVDRERPVQFGMLPIDPPFLIEPPSPIQFTVTFGFRLGRRDQFLVMTRSEAQSGKEATA